MTREQKEKLIQYLKHNLETGAAYLITDGDAVEIIKALEQEPCEDAISRQEAHRQINKWVASGESDHLSPLHERMDTLPSITLQPKTGKWILTQRDKCIDVSCSECGHVRFSDYSCISRGYTIYNPNRNSVRDMLAKLQYCECCGAKMQEVGEWAKN